MHSINLRELFGNGQKYAEVLPEAQAALEDIMEFIEKYNNASAVDLGEYSRIIPQVDELLILVADVIELARLDIGADWVKKNGRELAQLDEGLDRAYSMKS